MRRYLGALLLSDFLMAPVAMRADEHSKRYYDPYYRDYHQWNDGESRAYRHWLEEERHRQYHNWDRAKDRERREYWRWRHEHQDWDRR